MLKITRRDGTIEYYTKTNIVFAVLKVACNLALSYCIVHFIYKYW